MKYSNKKDAKNIRKLTLIFSLIVLAVLIVVLGLSSLTAYILVKMHVLSAENEGIGVSHIILFMAITSVVMGTIISIIASKVILTPLNLVSSKINSLANGQFGTRVDFDEIVQKVPSFLELSTVFNKLSEELKSTEMLRRDFINNFSHEFKTPIVSIAGFAKLLKKGNLSEEEKAHYLDAIEEESMRLASMATNVLNLTKIENQSILTDVSKFNLSEQIRSGILLLENKWSKKNIDFQLEFDEFEIEASEELLKQVWINLIDNAIKFSKSNGTILIAAHRTDKEFSVSITNYGTSLSVEKISKIFNKFYQGDESHSTEGNGIGLSIVQKIVNLHNSRITVDSSDNSVTFSVYFPNTIITELQ